MSLSKYAFLRDAMHPELIFIIRTQPPIVVGQVVRGNIEQMIRDHQPIAHGKQAEQNEWAVFFSGKLDREPMEGSSQEQADQLAKIMRKMSDFYIRNRSKT